jgi:hypothetical protein
MPCPNRYHVAALAVLAACAGQGKSDADADTDAPADPVVPACTEQTPVACEDAIVSDLSLHDDLTSDGRVKNTADGADWVTEIDATAGGFGQETFNPWVYVRFTEEGAERVNIDDETALESMEWHLAARRFILRLNGGSSGPSCVGAATFLEKSYDELTEVPSDAEFVLDDYYTTDCTLINDSSGLEGSPQVALSAWWEYPGCVKTTRIPFLVQLEDGHVIKLRVEQYYGTDQATCNQDSLPGGDSGTIEIRWTYVE